MKEHPDIVKFCRFPAYVRTHSTGILRGLPLSTRTLEQSLVCYTLPKLYTLSRYARTQRLPPMPPYRGRPSSHKVNLIPQNKRQDTTVIVIPCLCLFTALRTLAAEPPINKKRTRTLFCKESGSSTNCMVGGTGLEQGGSDAQRQSKQSAQRAVA